MPMHAMMKLGINHATAAAQNGNLLSAPANSKAERIGYAPCYSRRPVSSSSPWAFHPAPGSRILGISRSSPSQFSYSYNSLPVNTVRPSQTQSNHAFRGGDSLSPSHLCLSVCRADDRLVNRKCPQAGHAQSRSVTVSHGKKNLFWRGGDGQSSLARRSCGKARPQPPPPQPIPNPKTLTTPFGIRHSSFSTHYVSFRLNFPFRKVSIIRD